MLNNYSCKSNDSLSKWRFSIDFLEPQQSFHFLLIEQACQMKSGTFDIKAYSERKNGQKSLLERQTSFAVHLNLWFLLWLWLRVLTKRGT